MVELSGKRVPVDLNKILRAQPKRAIMAQEREFQFLQASPDETLERLVTMTNQTNLVALDKTLAAIRRAPVSYAAAAARIGSIAERIVRAVHEVGMTLPPHQRAV